MLEYVKRLITPDMVFLGVPSGQNRLMNLVRPELGGQCFGTHPNVPVLPNLTNPSVGWHFDGVDDYVEVPHASSLTFTSGNFTISSWIRVIKEADVLIVNKGKASFDGYYFYLAPGGTLRFRVNQASATQVVIANDALVSDTWTHTVVVRDGVSGKVYVNGVDETESSETLIDPVSNSRSLVIGAYYDYSLGIDGYIAFPFIANTAWSVARVKNFYNQTKGFFAPR